MGTWWGCVEERGRIFSASYDAPAKLGEKVEAATLRGLKIPN
jgi:hypothetical protein